MMGQGRQQTFASTRAGETPLPKSFSQKSSDMPQTAQALVVSLYSAATKKSTVCLLVIENMAQKSDLLRELRQPRLCSTRFAVGAAVRGRRRLSWRPWAIRMVESTYSWSCLIAICTTPLISHVAQRILRNLSKDERGDLQQTTTPKRLTALSKPLIVILLYEPRDTPRGFHVAQRILQNVAQVMQRCRSFST